MKLALYQMNIVWENKEGNINKLEKVLETVSERKIDLLLLPEMSLTGFSMNTDVTGESDYETVRKIKKLATEYKVAIGVGWTKKLNNESNDLLKSEIKNNKSCDTLRSKQENDKFIKKCMCENHYSILGPDEVEEFGITEEEKCKFDSKFDKEIKGDKIDELDIPMMFDYAKIHPFSYSGEDRFFVGGEYPDYLYYKGFNISAAICYDLRFPEIFQVMSKKAEMIIVPANWPEVRIGHWDKLLMARAIENQCYIAGINCVGEIGGVSYCGGTMLVNPNGDTVIPDEIEGSDNGEMVLIYEIDNDVDNVREAFPVKKDRREKIYESLLSE
ncbi:MAG: hypothetical protein IJ054_01775 [Lachnospiraceae bacterium]|nr:hypothetical protein [Lachnospiraceae bacterium]MBQ9233990.1 hypothetical protein [Lachnospiraceae bacterium]